MLHHYWTVLTKKSYIDQDSHAIVIGEIIEEIQFGVPMQLKNKFEEDVKLNKCVQLPFDFEIVSYLGSDKPEQKFTICTELELPNKHIVKVQEQEFSSGASGKFRNRIRSVSLPVAESGTAKLRVFDKSGSDKRLLTEIPITINIAFAQG